MKVFFRHRVDPFQFLKYMDAAASRLRYSCDVVIPGQFLIKDDVKDI